VTLFRKDLEIPTKGVLSIEISTGADESLVITAFEAISDGSYLLRFER
jgi:hypothetical protein